MALSISCCCNLSPLPPSPSSLSPNTAQVAWPRKENSWKNKCVLGVACMIVGLEMGDLVGNAIAGEMQVGQSNEKVQRWSDKRKCPPWQVNSLETIVPENLPRPSAHRRWEAVGYSKGAPALNVATQVSTKCFSM